MAPQLFGIEHILYLIISTVVSSAALLLAKKYAKTENIHKAARKNPSGFSIDKRRIKV